MPVTLQVAVAAIAFALVATAISTRRSWQDRMFSRRKRAAGTSRLPPPPQKVRLRRT